MNYGIAKRLNALNGRQLALPINGTLINTTSSHKYLGVNLDSSLNLIIIITQPLCKSPISARTKYVTDKITNDVARNQYFLFLKGLFNNWLRSKGPSKMGFGFTNLDLDIPRIKLRAMRNAGTIITWDSSATKTQRGQTDKEHHFKVCPKRDQPLKEEIMVMMNTGLTWIKLTTTLGSKASGNRRMLNKEIATKAFPAVSSLPRRT